MISSRMYAEGFQQAKLRVRMRTRWKKATLYTQVWEPNEHWRKPVHDETGELVRRA
jgi:hypothetical protein